MTIEEEDSGRRQMERIEEERYEKRPEKERVKYK